MKKTFLASLLIVAAAFALPAGTLASKAGSGKHFLRFTLVGKLDTAQYVDNPPAGPSPGDVLVFSQKLYNPSDVLVGSDRATCTRTSSPSGDYLCSGAFLLPHGEITIQGVDPPENVARHPLVVTGGSGRFLGVRGKVMVHHVSPVEDRFHFKLVR